MNTNVKRNMKPKTGYLIVAGLILAVVTYFACQIGYHKSFQNFAGSGTWPEVMTDFKILKEKDSVELRVSVLANEKKFIYRSLHNDSTLKRSLVIFYTKDDTIEYLIKYKGDSSSWKHDKETTVQLFEINQRKSLRTFDAKNKKGAQHLIEFFKIHFVDQVD